MSKAFREYFEKTFNIHKKKGTDQALSILADLKKSQPVEVYSDLIKIFSKQPANLIFRKKGRKEFRDLLWVSSIDFTTIEKEFVFATFWLKDSVDLINKFRSDSAKIENFILEEKPIEAYSILREHIDKYGWSLWAAELEFAISAHFPEQIKGCRKPHGFIVGATQRIASLVLHVIKDRNDSGIPIGRFMEKCENSFHRLNLSKSVKSYLFYRAHCYMGDIRETIPQFLSIDMGNSPVDYYETLVDSCATILMDTLYSDLRTIVLDLTSKLIKSGIDDFRLKKINFLAGGLDHAAPENVIESQKLEIILDKIIFFRGNPQNRISFTPDVLGIQKTIDSFQKSESLSYEDANFLIRFGLNFRGLKLGAAIFGYISNVSEGNSVGAIVPGWGQFASPIYRFHDFLGIPQQDTLAVTQKVKEEFKDSDIKKQCVDFIDWAANDFIDPIDSDLDPSKLVWAARNLISQQKTNEAFAMALRIKKLGGQWTRYANNIEILASIESGDLANAISATCSLLIEDERMNVHLPLQSIFKDRKWKDYKSIDPKIVAVVSAASYETKNDSNSRFICQMACRAYFKSGMRDKIIEEWDNLDSYQRSLTIQFLNTVWIEDNLSMAGFLTTQEVQRDRIAVLQLLLQLDVGARLEDYAEEIKNLTFSETLLQGLKHIESSRIFVNEGAIARWAEKELQNDFDRWKKENAKDSIAQTLDDVVRQYLMGDSIGQTILFRSEAMSENNIVLLVLTERLLNRFLSDPSDGLNCYLSSRIRHGTLKGTLLGPLDEAGLLGMSDIEIEKDWRVRVGEISAEFIPHLISCVKLFNKDIENIAARLINETVQIQTADNPQGKIFASISGTVNFKTFLSLARESPFPVFLSSCFDLFWLLLAPSLNQLADQFRTSIKYDLESQFEKLITSLRPIGESSVTLTTSLRTVATATQAQCDVIANWFQSERALDKHVFSLAAAIEIATASTGRVYRNFPVNAVLNKCPNQIVPLTSLGLSAITDCLYIMLENSFKHSGLKAKVGPLEIETQLDVKNNILKISLQNPLSVSRLEELKNGELLSIREKYIKNAAIEKAASEGGSGFAKLARVSKTVDTKIYPDPISIHLNGEGSLTVSVCIPIYPRGEAFDAYFS